MADLPFVPVRIAVPTKATTGERTLPTPTSAPLSPAPEPKPEPRPLRRAAMIEIVLANGRVVNVDEGIARIGSYPINRIDEPLPWNIAASPAAARATHSVAA